MNEGTFLPSNDLQNSPLICEICGDVARGLNFNVVTCVSCKVFFRRNAYRQQVYTRFVHRKRNRIRYFSSFDNVYRKKIVMFRREHEVFVQLAD